MINRIALTGVLAFAVAPAWAQQLLSNGDFSAGLKKWTIEETGAKGKAEVVPEAPGKRSALRLKVVKVGTQSWNLQAYQGGIRIKKGQAYTLKLWAKSDRPVTITVNCMQNHAPWEHHGAATEVALTPKWQLVTFPFVGPWNDDNARVTFTNLGTVTGQTYWFAGVSLTGGKR